VRHVFLAAAAAACVVLAAPTASANGRFPASNALYFSPSNDQLVILRATFGFLPSYNYGTTWTWLCEDALGLPPQNNEDPSLGLTQNNTLIAGISLGLEVSPNTGCTWTTMGGPLAGQLIKDIVVRPNAPDDVLAITSTYANDAGLDGSEGYSQTIYSTTNDGTSWSPIGTIDPSATVTTIEVAATDPQRIYVSAFRGEGTARTVSIFTSTNGGTSWTESVITQFDPNTESAVYIAAVSPTNEDVVYIRSDGASHLYVTNDGAKTFQQPFYLQGDEIEGFALSQDGSTVYLGGPSVGLYSGAASDLTFTNVSSISVQCLATHGTDLWACSDEVSGFVVGVSQDGGKTFTPKLHLTTIQGPTACAPDTTTGAICTATNEDAAVPYNPFWSLCTSTIGACYELDSGQPLVAACVEAGACQTSTGSSGGSSGGGGEQATGDAGSGTPPSKSGGCGCSVVGGGGAAGALLGLAIAAIATRRRRTR
jgi:MYXO-CTERM domain-containing protein